MQGQRSALLTFAGPEVVFTVERWFMPVDAAIESTTRFALVWSDPQDPTAAGQRVVLLSERAAQAIAQVLGKKCRHGAR